MTHSLKATRTRNDVPTDSHEARRWTRTLPSFAPLLVAVLSLVLVLSVIHLTQGTSNVTPGAVLQWATGRGSDFDTTVILNSRLPRLLAGIVVGVALGGAGALMQLLTRNALASPDTLAVNAGAYLSLTVVAVSGVTLSFVSGTAVAFIGGLIAAGVVVALSRGSSPVRLVLAGSVIAMGLSALTTVFLLFYSFETQSLVAWGSGSLGQIGMGGVLQLAVVVGAVLVAVFMTGHKLDVMHLGDDAASSLGINVVVWRTTFVVLSVLLAASAVTVAGPIAFVGLCAPALTRIAARWVAELSHARSMFLMSMIVGVILVVGSDVILRAVIPGSDSVSIPTGIVTSIIGAIFLIVLAQGVKSGFDSDSLVTMKNGTKLGFDRPRVIIGASAIVLALCVGGAILVGDTVLFTGDVVNYLNNIAPPQVEIVLESRIPRVFVACLAGACLALAGVVLQGTTRNPLADPGVLGVSGGAGLGAVFALTVLHKSDFATLLVWAGLSALVVGLLLFGLAGRGGFDQARMVVTGIGIATATQALTTCLIVVSDPWNRTMAMTWLSGSTSGVTLAQVLPMVVCLVLGSAACMYVVRDLDVIQIDDSTPRILGVNVVRHRVILVLIALILVTVTTVTIGVIAFVGLVAPHVARLIVGARHAVLLPLASLTGAVLVVCADALGRTIVAPGQIPAGLATAIIGCPYFLWLLVRMRKES
ncbi:iron ABC transporter permease [Brevibacterium sp. UMB1308A]|uniref:iron ABC transporter permease n=1 Tax=Brevibacterium sp. UMB1308A TaxID=3050608 RepID=UPI00254D7505|nr:iron ABC transporter permease [Brevibacterium sp. UMB1308A]MDK8346202.1 iron ABC transporter permease [Brevibacterium sp. UMB1308B]MDK8712364.1 iron ABC transporter permease [Brevibacterium sp. UMB1308A]